MPLTRSFGLVFSGNILGAVFSALTILVISRKLSVSDFGLFTLCLTIIRSTPLLTSFGLDTSMMKFASSHIRDGQPDKAAEVVKTTLWLRLLAAVFLAVLIYVAAGPLSLMIFHSLKMAMLLRVTALGVLAASLFTNYKTVLWTYQLFKKFFFVQILTDSSRFVAVVLFAAAGLITPGVAVIAYCLSFFLGVSLTRREIWSKIIPAGKIRSEIIFKMLAYSKWIFLSDVCRMLTSAIGLFIVAHSLGSKAAGLYGLATTMTYLFPIIVTSLKAVLVPRVSRFSDRARFKRYIQRSLQMSSLAGIALLPLIFFSQDLIRFFFGIKYAAAAPIFNILLLASIFSTIHLAIYAALYALNRPFIIGIVDIIKLIAMTLGIYLYISPLGIMAPPIMLLIVNWAGLVFHIFYISRLLDAKDIVFDFDRQAAVESLP